MKHHFDQGISLYRWNKLVMQYLFSLLGIYLYIRLWLLLRYHTTTHCDSLGLPMLDLVNRVLSACNFSGWYLKTVHYIT